MTLELVMNPARRGAILVLALNGSAAAAILRCLPIATSEPLAYAAEPLGDRAAVRRFHLHETPEARRSRRR